MISEAYLLFNNKTKEYLTGELNHQDYVDFVDNFWFQYEDDLLGYDLYRRNTEYDIVSDIREIVDRYDSCQAIVETDSYCISGETMKNMISAKIVEFVEVQYGE